MQSSGLTWFGRGRRRVGLLRGSSGPFPPAEIRQEAARSEGGDPARALFTIRKAKYDYAALARFFGRRRL